MNEKNHQGPTGWNAMSGTKFDNMLSLSSNLNALDGISKVITFTFDGLFARDVQ